MIYSTTTRFPRGGGGVGSARPHQREAGGAQSARRTPAGCDIKLAPGGIRDIEFLVQCLQRLHGGREPWVRHGGTLFALFRLHDKDLLSASGILAAGLGLRVSAATWNTACNFTMTGRLTPSCRSGDLEMLARKMPAGSPGETAYGGIAGGAAWKRI